MRNAARIALAIVVLWAALLVVPRSGGGTGQAFGAVPTPLISELLGESPSPSPSQDDDEGGSGGGGGSGDGSGGSRPGGSDSDSDRKDGRKASDGSRKGDGKGPGDGVKNKKKSKKKKKDKVPTFIGTFVPSGPLGNYDTDELVAVASHLRALGWTQRDVIAKVYPPFIIAGPAAWTNTWGAPRYGPGPLVRKHQGQDVFCSFGDPVLAPEAGTVSFDDGGLGGVVARVHLSDGSYWYLAHLSGINEELRRGDPVRAGDVLGYCGNSGNAITTPPHVHFGWYDSYPEGRARNPMRQLIEWLEAAEVRAEKLLARTTTKRVKQISRLTAARRFGDGLISGISELRVPGESLYASGRDPASAAMGLAEAALQAALSGHAGYSADVEAGHVHGAGDGEVGASSELARLLHDHGSSSEFSD